ncbi:T9SS type B sorting domain-containing protein [Aquimarina pacifica]|uniref:T9SS type B sorting domain-containing protein n=1 Tax=Aquimarina pacifica TaxID=1296415 RepID=UPI00046EA110|nr:gliding motility-associated C-terminal domain-containing protein [Aquimarina pacifica]
MRKNLNLISVTAVVIGFLFSTFKANSQTIDAPSFSIDGDKANILCVTPGINPITGFDNGTREALATTFTTIDANTEFILELSDAAGVFSDETTVELSRFTTSVGIPANGEIEFPAFPIPSDTRGENYSLRIRIEVSGGSDVLSTINENIPIYYFDSSQGITLTGPNIEANTVALCTGESATLTTVPDDFPEYRWYLGNPDLGGVLISGESGPTLENVTEPGTYFVEVDFGSCNGAFSFDRASVEVFDFNQTTVAINESSPQEFCPSDVKLLTTSVTDPNFTYEWFRDGVLVPEYDGPVVNLPQSNFGGTYTVNIIGTETCSITTNPVVVVNLGSDILTQPPPEIILLPTQTAITLAITTNAPEAGSTIQWFQDDISGTPIPLTALPLPISTPGALSIDVDTPGVYTASLFADDSCMDTLESITEVFEPVGFRTEITTLLDCDDEEGTLGLENLYGITDTDREVPITEDQYSFFDFEWFLGTESTGVTETSITVGADNIGEVYALEATLTGSSFEPARSNELTVDLLSDVLEIEASATFIAFGESVTLSVLESASYQYEWFVVVDGENQLLDPEIITGQGTNSIEITDSGQYIVIITLSDCVIESEPITISDDRGESALIPNVITPFGSSGKNDYWVLPDTYSGQQDVEIIIYDSRGRVDFATNNYQDDWPLDSSKSGGEDPIYYYIITKNNSVVRKGSITVMR